MKDELADFVLVGSTPFAFLLAGLLAGEHGRRVLLVGGKKPSHRLPRGIDLSCAPITRPESWDMVVKGIPELLKLIGQIAGRHAWTHVDPIFFSDDPRAAEALSHMRHMAIAFGIAAEPAPTSLLGEGRHGVILRDAALLDRAALEPHLSRWLARSGVEMIAPEGFGIADDGSAVLNIGGTVLHARQTILADDAALLAHLPEEQWPDLLVRHAAATILVSPARSLAAPVMAEIHSGLTLIKQAEGGIAAIGVEAMTSLSARVQGLLSQKAPLEQVGQKAANAIATRDGAPALGKIGGVGVDIVAGLGPSAMFLAPAFARWLSDEARPHEAAWFGARLVSRAAGDASVAEYAPDTEGATA